MRKMMLKDANSTWLIATQLLSARASVNVPINFKNYFRQHGLPVVKYTDLKCHRECLHVCTRIRPLSQEHCINNHSRWLAGWLIITPDGSHSAPRGHHHHRSVWPFQNSPWMGSSSACHLYLSSLAQHHMVFTHGAAGINRLLFFIAV